MINFEELQKKLKQMTDDRERRLKMAGYKITSPETLVTWSTPSGGYAAPPTVGGGGVSGGPLGGLTWTAPTFAVVSPVHYYFPNNHGQHEMLGVVFNCPFIITQTDTVGRATFSMLVMVSGSLRTLSLTYDYSYLNGCAEPAKYVLRNLIEWWWYNHPADKLDLFK